ncbi:hypothetical protein D556_2967 [Bordetella holmesii 41130]|nr:hypothetical protein D556_2967 [Bordetella holmesii 41130]EWM49200.1 hypothetical protein D557_2271 [Bordetella holmesii 70147]
MLAAFLQSLQASGHTRGALLIADCSTIRDGAAPLILGHAFRRIVNRRGAGVPAGSTVIVSVAGGDQLGELLG